MGGARDVTVRVGDSSPLLAIGDELRAHPGEYDQLVIRTLPGGTSRWLRLDIPHELRLQVNLPVTHIVAEPTDSPTIAFRWILRLMDGSRVRTLLAAACGAVREGAPPGYDQSLAEALASVGLHRDHEPAPAFALFPPSAMLEGSVPLPKLMRAIDSVLREPGAGLVVDTRYGCVEINEHPSVSSGTVVLIDDERARFVGTRIEHEVTEAIRDASAVAT